MRHEIYAFPSLTLDRGLRVTFRDRAAVRLFSGVRTGAHARVFLGEDGVKALEELPVGGSCAVECVFPFCVRAVASRVSADEYALRVNAVTSALLERVSLLQSLEYRSFRELLCMGGSRTVTEKNVADLGRTAYLQKRLSDFLSRVVSPLGDEFCYTDLAASARFACESASVLLHGTSRGALFTGEDTPFPVFVSRKDLAYVLLGCFSLCYSLGEDGLAELCLTGGAGTVNAGFLFKSRVDRALFEKLARVSPCRPAELKNEFTPEQIFLAANIRLLCEINGGVFACGGSPDTAFARVTFPSVRDDSLPLCEHPLPRRAFLRYARTLLLAPQRPGGKNIYGNFKAF